ncbi:MAG: DMT family transporter [Patescibacteria group bacterium]
MPVFGLLFALIALFGFAFSDFLMQRSTRGIGIWRTRFVLSVSSAVILLPFVFGGIGAFITNQVLVVLLVGLSALSIIGGYFGLKALKLGKLSVIEPINGLELPFTVILSVGLLHEALSLIQVALIVVIFAGIMLTVTRRRPKGGIRRALEKGTAYAFVGVFGLGIANLTIGVTSRMSSPVFVAWSMGLLAGAISFVYLVITKRLPGTIAKVSAHARELFLLSIISNVAWISYGYATIFLPISIATALSESYIALAVLLGVIANRERLRRHQIIGIILTISGVICLAAVTH